MARRDARALLAALAIAVAAAPGLASESGAPCADRDPQRRPYFGDLHVHTAFSQDASTQGTRATPRDAYRFARGEPLGIQPHDSEGRPLRTLRLARSLDFAAVTDHAEQLGEVHVCRTPGLPGHDSLVCRTYRRWPRLSFMLMNYWSTRENPTRFGFCGEEGVHCLEAARAPWGEIVAAAEGANDRCRFTTFVAYEWTGAWRTNNLHRNVIFRDERVPALPTSFYEAPSPALLWEALRRDCLERGDGCDALVIPHNSNLSDGLMFALEDLEGEPVSEAHARTRAEMEPLVEVMQHKGDSECDLASSPEDELCGFEKLSYANFMQKFLPFLGEPPHPSSFVREALKQGLLHEERSGVNPLKLGLIASTDTHLAAAGWVDEREHPGHGGAGAPARDALPEGLPDDLDFNPGGLAGVWAEENTRDALFDALERREVFGTSGPRIVLRLFGGWRYPADLCEREDFVARGYAGGVPMGGDLPPAPDDAAPPAAPTLAPTLAVWALRDAGASGTPLQRLQIVKGWVEDGAVHEAVHDVAGDPGQGSVDPRTCRTSGEGADHLCTVWRDPDFDPDERAFYYARAVESPTCRWSARVCNAHGVDCGDPGSVPDALAPCCAERHRRTIQERAWSSPIWYAP